MIPLIALGIACVLLGSANELTKDKKSARPKPATKGNTSTDEQGNPKRGAGGSIDHGNHALANESQSVIEGLDGPAPLVKDTADNEHSE